MPLLSHINVASRAEGFRIWFPRTFFAYRGRYKFETSIVKNPKPGDLISCENGSIGLVITCSIEDSELQILWNDDNQA
jgi:hypothetical protein